MNDKDKRRRFQLDLSVEDLDDAAEQIARMRKAWNELPERTTVDEFIDAMVDRYGGERHTVLDTVHWLEKLTGRALWR